MIRLARPEDAAQVAAIYAPSVSDSHTSFELVAPDAAEVGARISKTLAMYPWLVFEREGRVAGYAYASAHRERRAYQWSVDVSCYVHGDFRGQGVGSALYRALFGVLERQGFHGAFAGIALPNDASVRLHESVGFEAVGTYREVGFKNGAWRDTLWMRRGIGEARADPPAPTPLGELGARVLDQP